MGKEKDHSRNREYLPRFFSVQGNCETVASKVQDRRLSGEFKTGQGDRSQFWDTFSGSSLRSILSQVPK
jgi:hypothetical protein